MNCRGKTGGGGSFTGCCGAPWERGQGCWNQGVWPRQAQRGVQEILAVESVRIQPERQEIPVENNHAWLTRVIVRSEPKSNAMEAEWHFSPRKGSETGSWRR